MSDFVNADSLGKVYDVCFAVRDVSFKVKEHQIYGLIGSNGAGKTTTLRMVCGMLDPTEGSCTVGGFDTVKDKIDVKRITGYLPEEDYLYGDMTVRDHLRYMGELFGVDEVDERIHKTLNTVDMESKIDDVIKTLSKGQRRRVAIAKTLIHEPSLVLLDEVTSGLDPVYSRKMVEVVKRLKTQGKTVIFSTHLLDEATMLCDKLMIISGGEVRAQGTIAHILKETESKDLEDAFFKLVKPTK